MIKHIHHHGTQFSGLIRRSALNLIYVIPLCLLISAVGCKSTSSSGDSTQPSKLHYVFDQNHVIYFAQDDDSTYHRFVTCFVEPDLTGKGFRPDKNSCVNTFRFEDDSPALFTFTALTSLDPPTNQWSADDIAALNRLKHQQHTLFTQHPSTPEPTPKKPWHHPITQLLLDSNPQHQGYKIARAGYVTIGAGLIKDIVIAPFFRLNQVGFSGFKLTQYLGMIMIAVGTGMYFLNSSESATQTLELCDDESPGSINNIDPMTQFVDTCGRPIQANFRAAAETINAKYFHIPTLSQHWEQLFDANAGDDTPSVIQLASGLAQYINLTIFQNNPRQITAICTPVSRLSTINQLGDTGDTGDTGDIGNTGNNTQNQLASCAPLASTPAIQTPS